MISASNTPLVGHTGFIQRHSEASFGDSTKTFGQVLKSLFANNEQGFALDYYDYSTLYQDAAGTIPVTAATQPVGLVLDKSKGLVIGNELIVDGGFNDPTKWITPTGFSISSGKFVADGTATGSSYQTVTTLNASSHYVIEFDVVSISGSCAFFLGSGATANVNSVGHKRLIMRRGVNNSVGFNIAGLGVAITVDNLSVKELQGNHAYQTNSSQRGLLRDAPRRIDFDGIDDKLLVNLPSALTNCTIVCATPFVGVGVETGVTTGTTFTLDRDSCATLLINRALTSKELSDVTRVFENLLRVSRMKYLIQAMFANNEQGFAYDMEDITPEKIAWAVGKTRNAQFNADFLAAFPQHVLYQDVSGTVPALLPSDPVALFKDKSGRNNHAYQVNSTSRPLLGRHPVSGARNLLTYSGTVTDASWQFTGGTKTGGQLDSDGGYTATKITGPSTVPTIKTAIATITGAYTYTVCLKAGTKTTADLRLRNDTTATVFSFGNVDLTTGVITGSGWTSKARPNGFWECSYTQATGISANDTLQIYYGATGSTDASFDIIVDYAQLEIGSVATPYQETTTLLDITEKGKADVWYLKYDGIDDYFTVSGLDLTGTDKLTLFAGIKNLSNSTGILMEATADANLNAGAFYMATSVDGAGSYGVLSRGTETAYAASTPFSAPHAAVLVMKADIASDSLSMRVNGVTVANTTANQGTGNYGNHTVYIGRRNGSSLPLNANQYSMIGVGRTVSDEEILQVSRAIAPSVGVNM